ncbi:hypothetical protein BDU57DRAFT_513027 [Ampelomyces quisqualis]|uniref:Uncharacterized protein n=1 Tax=Ampelomyces quisqualis TaxID=50730 RepID=A0A6A5QWQ3_AMPQU|nr:hypothetical protein BDU57DRAFT_513027 [Ampelomyces quisqualis]
MSSLTLAWSISKYGSGIVVVHRSELFWSGCHSFHSGSKTPPNEMYISTHIIGFRSRSWSTIGLRFTQLNECNAFICKRIIKPSSCVSARSSCHSFRTCPSRREHSYSRSIISPSEYNDASDASTMRLRMKAADEVCMLGICAPYNVTYRYAGICGIPGDTAQSMRVDGLDQFCCH